MRTLLVLYSYHHHNTEKIAKEIAAVLNSQIKNPTQISHAELQDYSLIGFGSGIYDEKHHKSVLDFADDLPQVTDKKAFIFSTSGITGADKATNDHSTLRKRLQSKGYTIIGEFQCVGFNTNSFLKIFGGMNKGRPNSKDLMNARKFAQSLK
jgi:flavodoxin